MDQKLLKSQNICQPPAIFRKTTRPQQQNTPSEPENPKPLSTSFEQKLFRHLVAILNFLTYLTP